MDIIKDLYDGKICPTEQVLPADEEYWTIEHKIGTEREYFLSILSDEDKVRFEGLNDLILRHDEMISYANFEHGFKIAARLLTAMLLKKSDN